MEKIIALSTKTSALKVLCYRGFIGPCLVMTEKWNVDIYTQGALITIT